MIRFSRDDIVDTERYDGEINRLGYIKYDRKRALNAVNYLNDRKLFLAEQALFVMQLKSQCRCYTLSKESVYRYLTDFEGVSEHYFHTGKTQSISLDQGKVLSKIMGNGKAVEFLDWYSEHKSMKAKHERFKKLMDDTQGSVEDDGLGRIYFTASLQKNRRFNYKDRDIIGQIPKDIANIITVEDDYFLVWGDFAQSDFRIAYNLFIRNEENDIIFNKYDDKYEALARIVAKELGQEFNLELFKEERPIYKKLTLATLYGTRSSVIKREQQFIEKFTEFLMKCPRYAEYVKRLTDHLDTNTPISVMSYFGLEQFVVSDVPDKNHAMFDALNMPIQSGTSEVVILTVNSILDMARKNGWSAEQFSLYMTRHDEPIFRIRKDAIESLWILQEHTKVLVDDWSPLSMDFCCGYNYKEQDEALMDEFHRVCKKHPATNLELSTSSSIEYYPVKPVLLLNVHWIVLSDGNTILTYVEPRSGKALFSLVASDRNEDIIKTMRIRLRDVTEKIAASYGKVCIRSNFYTGTDYFGELLVIYRKEYGPHLTYVTRQCKSMAARYCKKNGLALPDGLQGPFDDLAEHLEILEV